MVMEMVTMEVVMEVTMEVVVGRYIPTFTPWPRNSTPSTPPCVFFPRFSRVKPLPLVLVSKYQVWKFGPVIKLKR